jgi:hypothetical protein
MLPRFGCGRPSSINAPDADREEEWLSGSDGLRWWGSFTLGGAPGKSSTSKIPPRAVPLWSCRDRRKQRTWNTRMAMATTTKTPTTHTTMIMMPVLCVEVDDEFVLVEGDSMSTLCYNRIIQLIIN